MNKVDSLFQMYATSFIEWVYANGGTFCSGHIEIFIENFYYDSYSDMEELFKRYNNGAEQ